MPPADQGTALPHPDERRRQLEERFPRWEPQTLSQALDASVDLYGDQPLVITDERTYSYRDIQEWSRQLAAGLIASGVRAGDHVALIMANYPEFTALKYAIARAGATTIPINFLFRRSELAYVLEQSNARVLISMNELRDLDYLAELDAIMPGWETRAGGDELPELRHVFVFSTDGNARPETRSVRDLALLGTRDDREELARREAAGDPSSTSDILYTSGTTGRPKGVMMTHDMVLRTAYGSAYWCAFEPGRRLVFALPMYHVFGYVECLVASTFVGGAIIPHVQFDPGAILEAVERHRANEVVCVPIMTIKILETAQQRSFDLSALHTVFSSGGAAPPKLWGDIRRILGAQEILTAYGMTETTASTTCTRPEDPDERLLSTNGKLKYAGVAGLPSSAGCWPATRSSTRRRARSSRPANAVSSWPRAPTSRRATTTSRRRPRPRLPRTAGCAPVTSACSTRRATSGSPDVSRSPIAAAARWSCRARSSWSSTSIRRSTSPTSSGCHTSGWGRSAVRASSSSLVPSHRIPMS